MQFDEIDPPSLQALATIIHRILGRELVRLDKAVDLGLDPKETSQLKTYSEMLDAAHLRESRMGQSDPMMAKSTPDLQSRFSDDDENA